MEQYDLIVIGSGPAGEKGAAQAAFFGKRVALIERASTFGGACVTAGTIPSKTLRESALLLTGFRQREVFGLDITVRGDTTVAELMNRKMVVIEHEARRVERNLVKHQVDRFAGSGRFASPHEIVISGDGGETTLYGEVILIATGSSPLRPEGIAFDGRHLYDSDTILDLDCIPRTMAVVGAGVIGCEYASIFAALGSDVHLIDGRECLLGHVDQEIVGVLLSTFAGPLGIHVHLGTEVAGVDTDAEGVTLRLNDGESLRAEKVLFAAGRVSNTASLGLEAAGVVTARRGLIPVNDHFQTNVEHIYAAGDVIGFPALASTSMEQARVAMVHAFDLKYKTKLAAILPYGIYTIPEVGTIGITEEQAVERKLNYAVGRAYYRSNARGQIIGDEHGMLKLLFDAETRRLLGVHIVGDSATELLHVGMMVMQFGGTIDAFIEPVFNYPTLGDSYKYAAYDGLINLARAQAFDGQSPR